MKPLLHVLIPAYGRSQFLYETLCSIPPNYFEFAKFTVVEDVSEFDSVRKIVKKFPRISYVANEKRLGIAGNFNKCFEISDGIFTQICGSDDLFNDAINFEELRLLFYRNDVDIFINKVLVVNKYGEKEINLIDIVKRMISPKAERFISNKDLMKSLAIGDWAYFPSIYWRTEPIKNIKFSEIYHTAMDLEFLYNICNTNLKVYLTNIKNIYYRRHKESASSIYSMDVKRYIEEFNCQSVGRKITKLNNWQKIDILLKISISIRLHILRKIISLKPNNNRTRLKYLKILFTKVN